MQCVYILTSVVYFVNGNHYECSVRDAPPSLQVEQVPWIHYNDDDVKPVDGPFSMDSNTIAADPGSLEMHMTHTPVLFLFSRVDELPEFDFSGDDDDGDRTGDALSHREPTYLPSSATSRISQVVRTAITYRTLAVH